MLINTDKNKYNSNIIIIELGPKTKIYIIKNN